MATHNLSRPKTAGVDARPISARLMPYVIDALDATATLDEAIGALTLAYEAVCLEAGANQTLAHSFCAMRMAIKRLDGLRDTLADAKRVETAPALAN